MPTASALKFVGAATWEALSGHPVATDVFTDIPSVAHVATGQHADLVVIAPATADLLARAAAGRADDLLTATLLVTRAPVLMAPAMHTEMWTHPATVANVATLRARGVVVIDPAVGRLTGADTRRRPAAGRRAHRGAGRPAAAATRRAAPRPGRPARRHLRRRHPRAARPGPLPGQPLVRSAGLRAGAGRRRPRRRGHPGRRPTSSLPDPPAVTVVAGAGRPRPAAAMTKLTAGADAVVMAAAVADFRPATAGRDQDQEAGRARSRNRWRWCRTRTSWPASRPPGPDRPAVVVGFAAETGDEHGSVLDYARDKLARKGCDLLVVNRVDGGRAFEVADNAGVSCPPTVQHPVQIPLGPKTVLAAAVCDAIAARLDSDRGGSPTRTDQAERPNDRTPDVAIQ